MPDPKKRLYFVAVVPPAIIAIKVHELKLHIRETYQSKAALNAPPHITLHMPFEWKESNEETLVKSLRGFIAARTQFELKLENFGAFSPRVIFINVLPSSELNALHSELHRFFKIQLNIFNANYRDLPYHPHMTVAFRDLRKSKFHLAWGEFRDRPFAASFTCDSVALLKHDGKQWEVLDQPSIA